MGIIGALIKSAFAGGNFGYIAQNVATTYIAVCQYAEDKKYGTSQLLYATGLIDIIPYIKSGQMSEGRIKTCIKCGDEGIVALNAYMDYRDIVNSIVSKKKQISKVINKTIKQGVRSPLYPKIESVVSMMLKDEDFLKTVEDYRY